ncbi:MAG: hypothetical protein KDC80_18255 [Saprospiraceae bacterium]|nr:hypothetical protein [Saprospiraceae bacterium]
MKFKLSLLLAMYLLSHYPLLSQDIDEMMASMSLGDHNAVILHMPYEAKFAEDIWKDYLKDFKGKTKKVKRSDELFTDDANVSYISNNTVDIYSLIESKGDGSELKMWMDLGGGFVDSENFPDAFEGVRVFLQGFEKQLKIEDIKIELKNEENRMKDLERDLSKLERLNEKYHKEIEDWKAKIAENESLIDTNVKDQSDLKATIEEQKETIRQVEVKLAKAEN